MEVGDHEPTAVDLCWKTGVAARCKRPSAKASFDPSKITCETVEHIMQNYDPPTWMTDIEFQVHDFNQTLLQGLHKRCPKIRQGPKKAYITEDLWQQRQEKLRMKAALKDLARGQRDERLVTIFAAWASTRGTHAEPRR